MKKSKGIRIWPSFSRNHFGLKRFPGSFGFSLVLGYLFLTTVFFCHPIIKEPSLLPYVIHGKNKNFPALQSADSLALFISKEIALDRFESLEPAYRDEPEVHRYIHSRIISLKAQLDRPDSSALNSNYELRPNDIFDAMAAYDIQYNLKPNTIIIEPLKELASHQSGFYPKVMALNRIGQFYKNVCFDLDSSWFYYGAARDTLEKIGPITLEHIHCYENLLTLSIYKRKNLDAIMYGNELCDFKRYSWKPDSVEMARALINRAFVLFREGDHDGSKMDDSLALELIDTLKNVKEYQNILRNEIMFSWNFDSAEVFYRNIEELSNSIWTTKKDFVNINRLIANFLIWKKCNYNKAIPHLIKAFDYELSQVYHRPSYYSNICALLSLCYNKLGQFDSSLNYVAKMQYLFNATNKKTLYHYINNFPESSYSFIIAYNCADLFHKKYTKDNKIADLLVAFEFIEIVNKLMYRQYRTTDEFSLLQFYNEESGLFFSLAVEICYELYRLTNNDKYLELFLQFGDRSKYNLMYRDIELKSHHDTIFQRVIKNELHFRARLKNEILNGYRDNGMFNNILRLYNKINFEMESINSTYSNNYLISEGESLKQIYNKIDNSTSIINTTQTANKMYLTFINKEFVKIIVFNFDSIKFNLKNAFDSCLTYDTFIDSMLFEKIIEKIKNKININEYLQYVCTNVIVIPDGIFHRIHFSYLFKSRYNIFYSPSLRNIKVYDVQDKINNVAAFSFSDEKTILYNKHSSLIELPGSYKEVNKLKKQYPSIKIYTGYKATKENFIKAYTDPLTDYIHLAVHGISNGRKKDDVKLYFRTTFGGIDSLYGFELLGLKSNVKKVVLSACQSASGKYIKGEGNFSLPRYFLINGAKNVYATNFDVIDSKFQNYDYYNYK